jgi:hypothetical protein
MSSSFMLASLVRPRERPVLAELKFVSLVTTLPGADPPSTFCARSALCWVALEKR